MGALKLHRAALSAVALAALWACDERQPGLAIAPGLGRSLMVGAGGQTAVFLTDAAHPDDRTVPEDLVLGDLWLWANAAALAPAVKVGSGVPSQNGTVAFRADGGAVAFLSSYRFRAGEGELWVAAPGQAPRKFSEGVRSFAWAPRGEALAYIAEQKLVVRANPLSDSGPAFAASAAADGKPAARVHSFVWAPGGALLAVRAPSVTGGALALVDAATGQSRELAVQSSDYIFAEDGALAWLGPPPPKGGDRAVTLLEQPRVIPDAPLPQGGIAEPWAKNGGASRVVGQATTVAFGMKGRDLLLLSTEAGTGDAFGTLSRVSRVGPADGSEPAWTAAEVARKVSEWRFSPRGELLVLSGYDLRSRAGSLGVVPAGGGALREIGKRVQSFQLSPAGDRVLYTVQAPSRGDFKVELWTAELARDAAGELSKAPRKLDEGVYGYQLSPDGVFLFYKARCGSGSRSCSLFRARLTSTEEPVLLSTAVAGFDLAATGSRLLIAHPHRGAPKAVDLALQDAFAPPPENPPKPFVLEVDPGSRFLDAEGKKVIAPQLTGRHATVRVVETEAKQ